MDLGDLLGLYGELQRAGCIMRNLQDRYNLSDLVGVGANAKVMLGEDLWTGGPVAVKFVRKQWPTKDVPVLREATILRWSRAHPTVLQFHGIYDTMDPFLGVESWAIITEYVAGGELFDLVKRNGPMAEDLTRKVVWQLFSAINFLHQRGVVHRDIKTENVIRMDNAFGIKLVDFGLATQEWDAVTMVQRCGSPGYIAPEVLRGERYGCVVDCFSVGVLMYILLAGLGPFRGTTVDEMLRTNMLCRVSLKDLAHVSAPARDLVSKLLSAKPEDRPLASAALEHPWFQDRPSMLTSSCRPPTAPLIEGKLRHCPCRRVYSELLHGGDIYFDHLKFSDSQSNLSRDLYLTQEVLRSPAESSVCMDRPTGSSFFRGHSTHQREAHSFAHSRATFEISRDDDLDIAEGLESVLSEMAPEGESPKAVVIRSVKPMRCPRVVSDASTEAFELDGEPASQSEERTSMYFVRAHRDAPRRNSASVALRRRHVQKVHVQRRAESISRRGIDEQ